MDRPSNMMIVLCCYEEETNNKWTYDLMDHLMVNFKTIMTLAFRPYIIGLDASEPHAGDEKIFIDLLMNPRVLHYTYDRGSLLSKSIFVYLH